MIKKIGVVVIIFTITIFIHTLIEGNVNINDVIFLLGIVISVLLILKKYSTKTDKK
jgi:uncharacterized membrane protein